VGESSPLRIYNNVLFPEPDCPIMETNSPSMTLREIPFSVKSMGQLLTTVDPSFFWTVKREKKNQEARMRTPSKEKKKMM